MRLHAGLAGHALNLIIAKHALQLLRRDLLVRAVADPRLGDVADPGLFKLRDQTANPAAAHALSSDTLAIHAARLSAPEKA